METSPHMQSIGKALGRVPSGVYILTSRHGGAAMAMMASWVQQAGFQPPAVSVAIAKGRPIGQMIVRSGLFALSIIGEADTALMKKYARGVPPGADPFEGVNMTQTPEGLPVLADALAYLECRLIQSVDFNADHDLYIAQVSHGQLLREGAAFAHQRGNGFHY